MSEVKGMTNQQFIAHLENLKMLAEKAETTEETIKAIERLQEKMKE